MKRKRSLLYMITETIFDILKNILPVVIAGLFSFFVAKYTYNKNTPLEKMEFAYNRVYYPLYRYIRNNKDQNINDNDMEETKKALKFYFDKYDKYIDFSTIKTFIILCECNTRAEEMSAYQKFANNVCSMNSYLRKRLGYLEPNIFQLYKCAPFKDKVSFWCIESFLVAFLCLMLGFTNHFVKFFARTTIILIMLGIILGIFRFFIYLWYRFKK